MPSPNPGCVFDVPGWDFPKCKMVKNGIVSGGLILIENCGGHDFGGSIFQVYEILETGGFGV